MRLEQNEWWSMGQMLMTSGFSSVVMPTNSQGLLTWGPQISRGLWLESRKSMFLVMFLYNRFPLLYCVFYFMHLQTLF